MKQLIYFLLLIIFLPQCKGQGNNLEIKNDALSNVNNYTLIYDFHYPREILVNDMVVDKSLFNSKPIYYKKRNSENKNKITHPHYEKGGVISPKELEKSMGEFALYNSVIHNGELQNFEKLKS